MRSRKISGNKQIDGFFAVHHSTRCIDARADLEDDVRIGQFLLVLETTKFDDGLETVAGIIVKTTQSIVREHAILTSYRDNIRSDADGTEVEQWIKQSQFIHAIVSSKGLHELEAYTTSREVWVGIFVV